MKLLFLYMAALLSCCTLASCSNTPEANSKPALTTEQELTNLFFASGQACEDDTSCNGAACDTERRMCVGVLRAGDPWLQKRVAATVAERLRKDESLKNSALELLKAVLTQAHSAVALKARTIALLVELQEFPLLHLLAQSESPALATQASLALCRLGHRSQVKLCPALTESDDLTIAVQAIDAMGRSGYDETLATLLETLNPDLDRMLIRASLQALERLGDQRSIRPLVQFLRDAPDYLKDTTVRTLRSVSSTRLGHSIEDWQGWVERNNPPPPPPYVLRSSNSTTVLGIPEP